MRVQFINTIDWIFYIVSLGLAIYSIFSSGVIQNYWNKTTDSFKSEVEAGDVEIPEFYFCDPSKRIRKRTHPTFEIDYTVVNDESYQKRTIKGIKTKSMLNRCVIVNFPPELKFSYKLIHHVLIKFNSTIDKDLTLTGYISKKDNLPFLNIHSHDGNPVTIQLNPKQEAKITIQEERTKYLPSNCRERPLLEYLLSEFNNTDMPCPVKCLPKWDLPGYHDLSKMYPACNKNVKLNGCVGQWVATTLRNMKNLCQAVSYSGRYEVSSIPDDEDWCSNVSQFKF